MRLVKSSLALLAFFAVVWAAVLITWQVQARTPGNDDLALYLIGLPLLLLAAYVVLRKTLGSMLGGATARNTTAPSSSQATASAAAPEARPPLALPILRASMRTAHGTTPADLLAASRAGARPALDEELTDAAGYPQFAGRAPDLRADGVAARLAELAEPGAGPDALPDAGKVRAIALLADVLDDLREPLLGLTPAAGAPAMQVRLSVLVDTSWRDTDVALLRRWLRGGWGNDRPGLRWTLDIVTLPSSEVPDVMSWIARTARASVDALASERPADATPGASPRQAVPACWLIAAADSHVDQAVTEAWAARGQLHGAANPQGLIAGEAAAGLFVVLPGAASLPGVDLADAVRLSDIVSRSAAAPAARPAPDTLAALMEDLFTAHGVDPTAIVGVASDADHRLALIGELSAGIAARLPDLAMDEACVPIGQACGHTGNTAQLASVVMAAHLARSEGGATLALSVTDSLQRSAALVVPAPVPPPPPTA